MRARMGRALAGAAVLLLTAGCAHPPATAAAPPVNLSGYPPAFREGYADGCNSAHGAPHKDAERMQKDALYAQGFHDGIDGCGPATKR